MRFRRTAIVLLFVFVLAASAGAQSTLLATHYQPGNVAFSFGAGLGLGGGVGASLYPGVEFIFAKIRPADVFSVDFGAGARGVFTFWKSSSSSYGYLTLGGAPVLSAHMGLLGFTGTEAADYLGRIDIFTLFGLGYQMRLATGTGSASESGLAFANFSGVNFFLTDQLAVALGTNYFYDWTSTIGGGAFSTGIGIVYKIGPAEEVEEIDVSATIDYRAMTGNVMYATFTSLYVASVALGGLYLPADESFEPGDGIRFRHDYAVEGDGEGLEYTRALLHEEADGTRWWRFAYAEDDDDLQFEARVEPDGAITLVRYADPGDGEIVTYEPDDPYLWQVGREGWADEDLEEMRAARERVTVAAGTFMTDRLEASDEEYTGRWWISDEVPGLIVKYEGSTDAGDEYSGELLEVLSGVTTPWDPLW